MNPELKPRERRVAASREATEVPPPVIVQTLSGYEIWLDSASEEGERVADGSLIFRFVVTTPRGEFQLSRVEITADFQDALRRAVGPFYYDVLRFWHTLAHNVLAEALEPPHGPEAELDFRVDELSPACVDLAQRWGGGED